MPLAPHRRHVSVAEAKAAYRRLEMRRHAGKVVIGGD
jgi:hypothetical protein